MIQGIVRLDMVHPQDPLVGAVGGQTHFETKCTKSSYNLRVALNEIFGDFSKIIVLWLCPLENRIFGPETPRKFTGLWGIRTKRRAKILAIDHNIETLIFKSSLLTNPVPSVYPLASMSDHEKFLG